MNEYRLSWFSNDGTGETVSLESDRVTPDRIWSVWNEALEGLFEPDDSGDSKSSVLTRDQFRKVVKALTASGDLRMATDRQVTSLEFRTGKGWVEPVS